MNEHELKSALQEVMVASSPPPPMSPEAALDRARRAQRRRKATWGGVVAGLAVVAIAVGAVLVPTLTGGAGGTGVIEVAGGPPSESGPRVTPTAEPPSESPSVTAVTPPSGPPMSDTKTPWPNGQGDRTATSGPRADKGAKLLNDVASSLPPGVKAEDRTRIGFAEYGPMTRHQSQFVEYAGELQVWEYWAHTPVVITGEAGVGELTVEVETKGNTRLGDLGGCEAATKYPYPIEGGTCEVVDVGGKEVGVVTGATADADRNTLEAAAFYRYPDGTLVTVAYSSEYLESGHPALSRPAFTGAQLAALAADPKFHLD
ncbi:hypothetical protein ADK67_41415 [Saccharothrix sp. NRRL B-16348]|uniref:hypothetical protein n=1 Tax=Saccharothrix sp. NRRL B-16348 TaxID=1415542 RepID=UPI0006AF9B05|nr:hypothetical protein [Saccharothrix sp. NRRL B-16348]KOX15578.1 hypothetical protein ADK67_41415 [Saccharothrix sp. NRRL B-16348]